MPSQKSPLNHLLSKKNINNIQVQKVLNIILKDDDHIYLDKLLLGNKDIFSEKDLDTLMIKAFQEKTPNLIHYIFSSKRFNINKAIVYAEKYLSNDDLLNLLDDFSEVDNDQSLNPTS